MQFLKRISLWQSQLTMLSKGKVACKYSTSFQRFGIDINADML